MRIAICDDIESERIALEKLCISYGYPDIVHFESGDELIASKDLVLVHLIFLDIEMPGTTGIKTMKYMEANFHRSLIVFCTSHAELMQEAFGRNVIAFLSKPFNELSVKDCLDKATDLLKDLHKIELDNGVTTICGNIVYIQSDHKYSSFHMSDETHTLSSKPLTYWAGELAVYGFAQISRSVVLNMKYIHYINSGTAILTNKSKLKISRRLLQELKNNYNRYKITHFIS